MTEKLNNKLRKFINKPRPNPQGNRKLVPVVLTDSKGEISSHVAHNTEREILWWYKRGSKIDQSTSWLQRNIARKIINHGDIWLYVWLGTCDLTTKNKKYISITPGDDEVINKIVNKYEEIIRIINRYPGSRLTILETPIYSIKKYNEDKQHKDPSSFEDQDQKLEKQVQTLNNKVREINRSLESHSPEFSSDLSNTTKYRCGNDRKLKTKRYHDFELYRDGIHPDELLAKSWLRKIAEQARKDCWE